MAKEKLYFLRQKRNLLLIGIWSAMLIGIVVGITINSVLYNSGKITDTDVYRRLWYSLLCFVMMSLLYVFEFVTPVRLPLYLEIALPVFAFAALAGGTIFNLYNLFPVWDKILHTLSGPLFAVVGLVLCSPLLKEHPEGKRKVLIAFLLVLLFTLAVGYFWEIFEYIYRAMLPAADRSDTIWDMAMRLIGATLFLVPMFVLCWLKPTRLDWFHLDKKPERPIDPPDEPEREFKNIDY